ncbi:helix-turn-helix domain-containing protein [Tabrizicola sp.]|uniref:helix-turn-helix domain-containing protein n=1 Tax=Tabrizicola sp. TaxID=2005166 RepID=UPI003F34A3F2
MTVHAYPSFSRWYAEDHRAPYVRTRKSQGAVLDLLEIERPAGDCSGPALPDLILCQDALGGMRVKGNLGGTNFDETSERGGFFLIAPNFANRIVVETRHRIRALAFPLAHWQRLLDEATDARFSFDFRELHSGTFSAPSIQSAFQQLWCLCDEEGTASRLMAQAAGCHIIAELCRISGAPLAPAKGGLAPWVKRRSLELMRARLAEDISLDELAAEAQLSPCHFARMFKHSVGVPPRVYLTQLRIEKACELLEATDLPVTEIAFDVGYSSNQVLARVFQKHRRMSPSLYRRSVRDASRTTA